MKFLLNRRLFLLLPALLAVLLIPLTPEVAGAQEDWSDHYTGTVPDPTDLTQYPVRVSTTLAPYAPASPAENEAAVGPYTDGTFQLTYLGLDGSIHQVQYPVRINNLTQDITVIIAGQERPVSTLRDVFAILPTAAAAQPAALSINLTFPVELVVQGVALAAPPKYITDATPPRTVITLASGRPGAADLTNAQAKANINGSKAGLYKKLTKTADPTWSYDCHGWTFTNGARWINNDQVQKILDDNGYAQVAAGMVAVGDVVVYKKNGAIVHTGVVTKAPNGTPTEVESKWGGLGR